MRGISPLIIMILLLLVSISLSSFAYIFSTQTMSIITETGEDVSQQTVSPLLAEMRISSVSENEIDIKNSGRTQLSKISVFVNDALVESPAIELSPGDTGTIPLSHSLQSGDVVKVVSSEGAVALKSFSTGGTGPQMCSDGTLYDSCSSIKPLYCDYGILVNGCGPPYNCGCDTGTCQPDGSCQSISPCSSLIYPSGTWQRIWYVHSSEACLGDGPDQSSTTFNNDWGTGTVSYSRADDIEFHSSRTISIPSTGTYTFTVGSDDGVRLWIDGSLSIDQWIERSYSTDSTDVMLVAGNHQLRLDWYENTGNARVSFSYTSSSGTCSDGTLYGQCSSTKPKYCDAGTLIDACGSPYNCGCSSGTCQADGTCQVLSSCTGTISITNDDETCGSTDFIITARNTGPSTVTAYIADEVWNDTNCDGSRENYVDGKGWSGVSILSGGTVTRQWTSTSITNPSICYLHTIYYCTQPFDSSNPCYKGNSVCWQEASGGNIVVSWATSNFQCSSTTCSCTNWASGSCGGGSCSSTQRQETRTCTPSGCTPTDGLGTSRCVPDISCSGGSISGPFIGLSGYPTSTGWLDQIINVMNANGMNMYRMSANPEWFSSKPHPYHSSYVQYFLDHTPSDWVIIVDRNHIYPPDETGAAAFRSNIAIARNSILEVCNAWPDNPRVWIELANEYVSTDFNSVFQGLIDYVRNAGCSNTLVIDKWNTGWSTAVFNDPYDAVYTGMHFYFNSWSVSGAETQMNYALDRDLNVVNTEVGADSNEASQFSSSEVQELSDFLQWSSDNGISNTIWMNENLDNWNTYQTLGLVIPGSVPTSDLAGYWKFDEGSGSTTSDSSVNDNTGTLYGGLSSTGWRSGSSCVSGSCLRFDGTDDYIGITNAPSLDLQAPFTVEAWVYLTAIPSTYNSIIYAAGSRTSSPWVEIELSLTSSRQVWWCTNTGSVQCFNSGSVSLNTWTHIAGTWDGTIMRSYVNGHQVGTKSLSGTVTEINNDILIGKGIDPTEPQYYNGLIDELKVFNKALSASEVLAEYESNACFCTNWVSGSCGGGSCSSTQRQETRTCTPTGCTPTDGLGTSRCVPDSSCGGSFPTYTTPSIPSNTWDGWRTRSQKESLWNTLWNAHGLGSKIHIAGYSVEGRNIYLFEAGNPSAPALFVDAQMHGNEDHAFEILTMFAYWLLNSGDADAQDILQNNRILFMPMVNTDRTDKLPDFLRCNANGVNLNRNFVYNWINADTRTGCDYYRGPSAGSEPETQAVKGVFSTYSPRVYVNLHTGAFMARAYGNSALSNQIINAATSFSSYFNAGYSGSSGGAGYSVSDAITDSPGVSAWLIEFFRASTTDPEYHAWRHDSTNIDINENRYYPLFKDFMIAALQTIQT